MSTTRAVGVRIAAAFALLTAGTAAAAWVGTELVMAPTGADRVGLIAMYAAIASAVFVIGLALVGLTRRSLSRRILVLSVVGPLLVGAITIIGAWSMFISSHDTQFVVILAAAATALAAGLVHLLVNPMRRDLDRIAAAADRIGSGDLDARAGLERPDELGELAGAFDDMATRLQDTTEARRRMEAERRFMLSSLSHDARTPLTAMRAAIEALQDGLAPDPERYLDSIEHDLRAVEGMIENLFVIAKLEADQLEPHLEVLDLAELAADAVAAIEPLAKKYRVVLAVEADGVVDARCARPETERMINNLLSNAIRHSPTGGRVEVRVDADSCDEPAVEVRDEGPGFPEKFVDRAFDQFARADAARDRAHGGAGLGLAVVKGLAEAQGGQVWVEPGPGGRIGFRLPAANGC